MNAVSAEDGKAVERVEGSSAAAISAVMMLFSVLLLLPLWAQDQWRPFCFPPAGPLLTRPEWQSEYVLQVNGTGDQWRFWQRAKGVWKVTGWTLGGGGEADQYTATREAAEKKIAEIEYWRVRLSLRDQWQGAH